MDFDRGTKDLVLRGIAAIVTCIVLIFLLVFFTNRETIRNALAGNTKEDASTASVTVETEGSRTAYGIQIGDNLKAFIADENFFDDHTVIPVTEEYTEEDVISISVLAAVEDDDLVIRLFSGTGTVLKGERFKATIVREDTDRQIELVFIDDDEDGVIRAKGLTDGEWSISIQEMEGYHAPTQPAKITIGKDEDKENDDDEDRDHNDDDEENNDQNEDDEDRGDDSNDDDGEGNN